MSGKFCCHICAEFYDNEGNLQKHLTTVHSQVSQKVQCPKCNRAFSRKDNLKAHIESVHRKGASKFICQPCQKSFLNASTTRSHALLQDQPALRHRLAVLKQFFFNTVCNVTGLGSTKTYEIYRQHTMHLFTKTQTTHNCCSKRSLLFCKLSVTTTDPWH